MFSFPIVAELTLKYPFELTTPWENFILIFNFYQNEKSELFFRMAHVANTVLEKTNWVLSESPHFAENKLSITKNTLHSDHHGW